MGLIAAAMLVACFGAFSMLRKAVLTRGLQDMRAVLDPVASRHREFSRLNEPGQAQQRLETFRRLAEHRGIWLIVLDKIARMLPENEKGSVSPEEKLWLIRFGLSAKPAEPGVYAGEIEAGCLLRPDGSHLRFAQRMLKTPLEADERGIFRNVTITAQRRSTTLSLAGGQGPDKYLVLQIKFEVVPKKGGES